MTTPKRTWAVTDLGHRPLDGGVTCPDCFSLAVRAVSTARATGSKGATEAKGDHSATVSSALAIIESGPDGIGVPQTSESHSVVEEDTRKPFGWTTISDNFTPAWFMLAKDSRSQSGAARDLLDVIVEEVEGVPDSTVKVIESFAHTTDFERPSNGSSRTLISITKADQSEEIEAFCGLARRARSESVPVILIIDVTGVSPSQVKSTLDELFGVALHFDGAAAEAVSAERRRRKSKPRDQ